MYHALQVGFPGGAVVNNLPANAGYSVPRVLPAHWRAGLRPRVLQVPYWPSVDRAVSQNVWLQSPKGPTVDVSSLVGDGV